MNSYLLNNEHVHVGLEKNEALIRDIQKMEKNCRVCGP